MPPSTLSPERAGRAARAALAAGEGEVCAVFRSSFYLRCAGERYACVGGVALGNGPLNALLEGPPAPALGERLAVSLEGCAPWQPAPWPSPAAIDLAAARHALAARLPAEGLACLIAGTHNALAAHAQPALEALERWLVGGALAEDCVRLIGLGPGLTPSGDDYFGGALIALHALARRPQAAALWRWLAPRLPGRTSPLSAAHLAAAAEGEGHEALHGVLGALCGGGVPDAAQIDALDAVGHCSGWDALAGALAVAASERR